MKDQSNITYRLQQLEERVRRLEKTTYGNGEDGVLSRLARIETKIEGLSSQVKWVITFAVGTFLGIIVTIIQLLHIR